MASRGSDSGGVAGVFGLLLLIWVVVTYYWIIIGVGAAIGLFFAIRALVRREQERRLAAAREAEILAHRADRQHRWARRGDARGIYGVEGAKLMGSLSPQPSVPSADAPDENHDFAEIVHTSAELDRLLAEKRTEWRWAAFVSVLVQRLADVRPRLRDLDLGYTTARGPYARNGPQVAAFVEDCLDDLYELAHQVESFIRAPALMDVFGDSESTADAEGIVHAASRLMDFHERFLELAERCRDVRVPSAYTGLLADCKLLMDVPLDGFHAFIDELVELVEEMPTVARYAPGDVDHGTVVLEVVVDDDLIDRIDRQVRAAAKD
ncbi:hypothetical protein H7I77_24740 [Mycolicibacterium novocastrense]|uniref:Uncharacterized protein n=1 Tax=Mycolicibacterium novocastrense TaxID=59813 RepID=A0AAW5SSH0_MYCNV|nr:hypothetical protein [Mycolicibacterium novocastrense]MCV7026525.1 hypothetical protein [Mycolicibacterium novocastrense]GAT08479.1 uncharacterized protein RMCN_1612 [Mycolicibacterium novocastrense]